MKMVKRLESITELIFIQLGRDKVLNIGGTKTGNGLPWFVLDKNIKNNTLLVGQGHDHPLLLSDGLLANDMHWISGKAPKLNWVYSAKTRYRQMMRHVRLIVTLKKLFNYVWPKTMGYHSWAICGDL